QRRGAAPAVRRYRRRRPGAALRSRAAGRPAAQCHRSLPRGAGARLARRVDARDGPRRDLEGRAVARSVGGLGETESDEWRSLYRRRSSVEREFGRLKHHYALAMLRVRGIERVRLHADLTILGRLALELARLRAMAPAT